MKVNGMGLGLDDLGWLSDYVGVYISKYANDAYNFNQHTLINSIIGTLVSRISKTIRTSKGITTLLCI